VLAATSIYGVDILQDNVDACRARMFEIWDKEYKAVLKREVNEDCRQAVRFILSRNIVCGNALTLKRVDAFGWDTAEPIVFSEWAFVTGFNLQRSDYTFDKLLEGPEEARDIFPKGLKKNSAKPIQQTLFTEPEKLADGGIFVNKTISHYRKVQEHGG
jgi:hypothetical protein